MNENNVFHREIVQKSATNDDQSRHAGSIPVARFPSESSTYADSVEPSVESAQNIVAFSEKKNGENESQIATEAGHWYLSDGTPYYTTPRRSGPRMGEPRPVSLRHDRALMLSLGVVPSSTGITRQLDAPALNAYRERHVFEATLRWIQRVDADALSALRIAPLEALDLKTLFKTIREDSQTHRKEAAERGISLHGAIESILRGDNPAEKWRPHCEKLWDTLAQYGIGLSDGESERSFAHPLGYGGKCDWHEKASDIGHWNNGPVSGYGVVIDFKSKDEIALDERGKLVNQLAGDEHAMQIASYANGLGIPHARGINVFVGESDRRIWIHEWSASELRRGWKMFQLLLRIWKIKNNYYPKPNL